MQLKSWRGNNVLITDSFGFPVLELDAKGNIKESDGREVASTQVPLADFPSLERLAAKVAIWIEWTAIEPGEFRSTDIHPEIRDRVRQIAEEFISLDEEDAVCKDFSPPTSPANVRAIG